MRFFMTDPASIRRWLADGGRERKVAMLRAMWRRHPDWREAIEAAVKP